jgi:hypothetical protein
VEADSAAAAFTMALVFVRVTLMVCSGCFCSTCSMGSSLTVRNLSKAATRSRTGSLAKGLQEKYLFPFTLLRPHTARTFLMVIYVRRMASSGVLCRVALVRTNVSEELSASIIRVARIGELGTTLAVTSNRRVLYRWQDQSRKLWMSLKSSNRYVGHCTFREHPYILGLRESGTCRKCGQEALRSLSVPISAQA